MTQCRQNQILNTPIHGQKDIAVKEKNNMSENINGQLVTRGIFNCRAGAYLKVCTSIKNSFNLIKITLKSATKHTTIRYQQVLETKY